MDAGARHRARADGCWPDYFTKILEDDLKAVTKPQYVDQIPKAVKGTNRTVGHLIVERSQVEKERMEEITEALGKLHTRVRMEEGDANWGS